MKREVNADELHNMLLLRFGNRQEAARVCPEVAEPEQPKYDYHADWTRHPDPSGNNDVHWTCNYCGAWRDRPPTTPHDHATCRARTRKQPAPSEPVIDEAVYEAGRQSFIDRESSHPSWRLDRAITAAVLKDRELRSNACGSNAGSSSSSSASPTGSACSSATSTAAPAADPRRLTDEEAFDIYHAAAKSLHYNKGNGLRAVADAQLAKAGGPVRTSRTEIAGKMPSHLAYSEKMVCVDSIAALLRSKGVEVVP